MMMPTLATPGLQERLAPFVRGGRVGLAAAHAVDTLLALPERCLEGRIDAEALDVAVAVAVALHAPTLGHTGLDLADPPESVGAADGSRGGEERLPWPADRAAWAEAVRRSPWTQGSDGGLAPFAVWGSMLQTRRMADAEERIVDGLMARAAAEGPRVDVARLTADLERLMPSGRAAPEQRLAAVMAVRGVLTIVSGGPGTGKTTTVRQILGLLWGQAAALGRPPPRVQLLAPTGKAAARLRESLLSERGSAWDDEAMWSWLCAMGGSTIHRVLGWQPASPSRCRHGRDRPCEGDVFVVDEASMVDVALMANLVDAVPPGARLLLLGDRNQLASVNAGSVLADVASLAGSAGIRLPRARVEGLVEVLGAEAVAPYVDDTAPAFAGVLVHFRQAFRFRNAALMAPIAALADASAATEAADVGDAVSRAVAGLQVGDNPDGTRSVRLLPPPTGGGCPSAVLNEVVAGWVDAFGPLCDDPRDPAAQARAVAALETQRVLAVHWEGAAGVNALDGAIAARVLRALHGSADVEGATGRVVMIVENAANEDLWNGDVGVTVVDADAGVDEVLFAAADGVRRVPRAVLPQTVGAFAMTVHKAQGSQFDHAIVVLPERATPLLTRELLYTAISRARDRLTVVGTPEVLRAAALRRVARATSLGGRLVAASEEPTERVDRRR